MAKIQRDSCLPRGSRQEIVLAVSEKY
ncbi:hypothetical protein AvCA_03860 [Azotobacter vinelandii CA]|uniref:Uncharacterized protein n=2 Tax=Azotobacter vinelandii TaxID=354 RepID=C1DIE9_AZOVD|nr:hypothetical protein Avin_03860 [Azotobacter vinelandii DJ]AGK15625.1 hypothetical protein AvCA_03860 [Azotobacter vinelandii CA]AGK19258.1 hypothetical protein AvCA6_03860 [Azotobacter vinelandii CA6]